MSDSNDAGSSSESSFKKDATSLREKSKSPGKSFFLRLRKF